MSRQPQEFKFLSDAQRALEQALSIDAIKNLRDKAQKAEAYAKKQGLSHEIVVNASVIRIQTERKLGQSLREIQLAKASAGNQYTGELDRSQPATGPIRLKDLNITKSQSSRAQQIARLPKRKFDAYVSDSVQSGNQPTIAGALKLAKQHKVAKTARRTPSSVSGFVTDLQQLIDEGRTYSTIYADPPWKHDNQASRSATDNHYPTMTIEEICSEPVAELVADKAHLHLWTTSTFLQEAFTVMEAWGFKYAFSTFVCVKPHLGLGNYWRNAHEILLLGSKKRLTFRDHSQRSWIEAKRTRHSEKPEEVRRIIEKVSPGPRLEMYGRKPPPNSAWTVYGNQLEEDPT